MQKASALVLAAMMTGLVAASDASAQACSLASLKWMAGDWRNSETPQRAQERWVVAPDDVLMGSAWEFPAGHPGYAEVMTIRASGDRLAMSLRHFDGGLAKAWEERDAPMVFIAARCGPDSVVFDGDGAHAGEHLTYKRSGRKLLITGDFLHHGKPDHEEWRMVRAGD